MGSRAHVFPGKPDKAKDQEVRAFEGTKKPGDALNIKPGKSSEGNRKTTPESYHTTEQNTRRRNEK